MIQWRQLLALSAIATQKSKLNEIAKNFCNAVNDIIINIFEWLLKHKSLTDTNYSSSRNESISLKQFDTKLIIEHYFKSNIYSFMFLMKSNDNNQMKTASNVFHQNLLPFVPLITLFLDLSPATTSLVHNSYAKSVQEKLYSTLLKVFLKDINALVTTNKHVFVTLSSSQKTKVSNEKVELPLVYESKSLRNQFLSANNSIPMWIILKIVLSIIIPVIQQEELFLKLL